MTLLQHDRPAGAANKRLWIRGEQGQLVSPNVTRRTSDHHKLVVANAQTACKQLSPRVSGAHDGWYDGDYGGGGDGDDDLGGLN